MVNSLTCSAKVKPSQIKLPLISVTTISSNHHQGQVVPSIAVSAEAAAEMSGLAMLTGSVPMTLSDPPDHTAAGIRNGTESGSGGLQDVKPAVSAAVKMEVLDDLFGSYGWDESASAMAAAVSAAASNNPFSSLLSQMTPLTSTATSALTSTATTKGTVKVPMASETSTEVGGGPQGVDTTFSPPPPPLPTISLASSLTTESLRVIIPSPHPGPDTTTTMGGSPVANHNNHTPTTPAPPTTPSSVASSSSTSSKKTVFTAKGML